MQLVDPVHPEFMQGKYVAIGLGTLDLDGKSRVVAPPNRPVQAVDQGIELGGIQILKSTEVDEDPMTDLPLVVAVVLDQLQVLVELLSNLVSKRSSCGGLILG